MSATQLDPTYECCADWKQGIGRVNAPAILEQARAGKPYPADYFIPFRFCPWCGGTRLTEQESPGPQYMAGLYAVGTKRSAP